MRLRAVSLPSCLLLAFALHAAAPSTVWADPPGISYIFPAGGQRGTTVKFRVGGLCLHGECPLEMLGPGVKASEQLRQVDTTWFEGPVIPQPASQQKEDYPKDYGGQVEIAADAPLGLRGWRVWTSQGATPSLKFVIGELPEVVENESEAKPAHVPVTLPVTINGRIFPREEIDTWSFEAKAGTPIHLVVDAARLGSPLDARLEVLDPKGGRVAESEPVSAGLDPQLSFTASVDGRYQVRIHDLEFEGLQHYIYRLSITTGPRISWVWPLGGKAGTPVTFEWGAAGTGAVASKVSKAEYTLPAAAGEAAHRFTIDGQPANPVWLEADTLAEHLETEPANDKVEGLAPIALPAVLNGRIGARGDADHWMFEAKKGDEWELDLRGARLGSPLDAVLSVLGPDGKEIGRSDDILGSTDAYFKFKASADGLYVARVAEQFGSRGGPDYGYRLRVDRPGTPDFDIVLTSDAVTVERGKEFKLKVDVRRRGGFEGEIALELEGLPAGITLTGNKIPAKQMQTQIGFKAEPTAAITSVRVTLKGTAEIAGQKVSRTASLPLGRGELPIDTLRVAVALPTPFKVVGSFSSVYAPRGAVHVRRYKIERGGFEGPLTVSLADRQMRHLQGVTGPTITVPPGTSEFDYPVYLPPYMEIGRTSRSCLMAIGEVEEQGTKHKISYSSAAQNDQIIILVDPGPLSLTVDRNSLLASPGSTAEVLVRMERARGLALPVTLELVAPGKPAGIVAEPVVVPADQNQGTLRVKFTEPLPAGKISALLRATAMDKGRPIVAELPLEIVPVK